MKRMILVVSAVALLASLTICATLILLYRSGREGGEGDAALLAQGGHGGFAPRVEAVPGRDGKFDLVVHNRGKAVLRLPGFLLPLSPRQRATIGKLRRYLLENGAVPEIVETHVPIYLPSLDTLIPEAGMANTLGYGENTFIVLRPELFDATPPGRQVLRTLYHELAHAYLARRYGTLFREIVEEVPQAEARANRMEALVSADEAFAWYAENVLADFWTSRDAIAKEPQRRERLTEIYRFKIAAHQEHDPRALYFWEPYWDIPRL